MAILWYKTYSAVRAKKTKGDFMAPELKYEGKDVSKNTCKFIKTCWLYLWYDDVSSAMNNALRVLS